MTIILSSLNRFTFFFSGRFFGKFAVKWILKLSPHLASVATLPCETSMSAKQAINDKLQGSVATYLRCSGVACTHALRAPGQTLLKDEESARDNRVFACNFGKYSPI